MQARLLHNSLEPSGLRSRRSESDCPLAGSLDRGDPVKGILFLLGLDEGRDPAWSNRPPRRSDAVGEAVSEYGECAGSSSTDAAASIGPFFLQIRPIPTL